jgi:hypothetical protein
MRLLGVLLLGGCLYVGEVNRAPTAALTVESPPQVLIKGATLKLVATMHDPEDGGNLKPFWDVNSADGSPVDPRCDYRFNPILGDAPGSALAEVAFFRTGSWVISFQTRDHFNAPSNTSTVMVQVIDAPPTLSVSDLSAKEGKNVCNAYVANQPLTLFLDGTVDDADAMLSAPSDCKDDETFAYRWEIVGLPATSHAVLGPRPSQSGDCPPSPAPGLDKIWRPGAKDFPLATCVYPDVGEAQVSLDYQIAFFVSDGTTEIRSNVFDAPVRSDLPPCLTGAAPAPASYVVDRSETQRFTVTGATDDLDPFPSAGLTFQWSIWREQDPVWRVVPDWTLSTYELDTSSFAVGEKLRVRVTPADRNGVRVTCDQDSSSCVVDSCLTSMCQAWMTWDLELR